MKKLLIVSALAIAVLIAAGLSFKQQTPTHRTAVPSTQRPSQAAQEQPHVHQYAATGRVPAYFTNAPDLALLPPTLPPEIFTGNERLAYQVAKEIPQILAQLPCYCHCDRGQGHNSLHSCFESEHGENCGICINEALMAHNLHKRGVSVIEIRKQIIAAYGSS